MERDKLHWEEVRKTWQASVDQDRERQEKRANVRTRLLYYKMFQFLNQCFARLRFWKSVSSKTAVAPLSRFRESETEVMQNTDFRIYTF